MDPRRRRDRFTVSLALLAVRLVVGVVFVWAGLGKFMATQTVDARQAEILTKIKDGAAGPRDQMALAAQPEDGEADIARVEGIALLTWRAAYPQPAEDGTTPRPLMPEFAAKGSAALWAAYAGAVIELAGGAFLIVGFLARLAGLGLLAVISTAAWLTTIGPAIQSGNAALGFLPDADPFSVAAWTTPLWQLTLIGTTFAVAVAGAGAISVDRLLFGRAEPDELEDDDDEE